MSFIRAGHELQDFKGESSEYIFIGSYGLAEEENPVLFVQDYDTKFSHKPSFAQFLFNMVKRGIPKEAEFRDEFLKKVKKRISNYMDVERR